MKRYLVLAILALSFSSIRAADNTARIKQLEFEIKTLQAKKESEHPWWDKLGEALSKPFGKDIDSQIKKRQAELATLKQ